MPVEIASGKWMTWRLPVAVALGFACAACQPAPRSPDRPEPLATQVSAPESAPVQPAPATQTEMVADPVPPGEAVILQDPPGEKLTEESPVPDDPPFTAPGIAETADLTDEFTPDERPPEDPVAADGPALPWEFAAEPPNLLSRPVPVFPDWADFDEIIGAEARFRIWLDAEGRVTRAELVEASAEVIVEPVREALLASRYRPVLTPDGFPVAVSFEETIVF
ncbi:MAG: hypothetical protein JJT96_11975 [Opitutales bacterium]|nr:hypothetical protein [Opitutales bacterium]